MTISDPQEHFFLSETSRLNLVRVASYLLVPLVFAW